MEWPWTMLKPVDMSATLVSNWTARWACTYVSKSTQTCFIHLRRLRQVRRLLGRDVTANLVAAITVLSRLDQCNALLAGLPYMTIAPLQRVINAAVRLVYGLHLRDHVSALRHAHNTIGNATLTTQHSTTMRLAYTSWIGSLKIVTVIILTEHVQESHAVADKPAPRESMPKIAPIRRKNKLQTS